MPPETPRFEDAPYPVTPDETSVNLRAYFDAFSDERLAEYSPFWTDGEVIAWDGNFRNDGALMLVCCDRDVDIREYRQVIEQTRCFRGMD
jgi:hypothetical protein